MSIESMKKFTGAVEDLIDYYAREFDITYTEVAGVLQMVIMDLHAESWLKDKEEDNGEPVKEGD